MNKDPKFASYPSLIGRNVLITGGASGIGEKLVEAFAAQSAQVIFLDIQEEAANRLIRGLEQQGFPRPIYFCCDLTDSLSLHNCLETVLNRFGSVDVLINNAGNDARHVWEEVTPDSWDRCMAINLKQQFFVTQAVAPGMKQRGRGSIINVSSIAWTIPSTGLPVYVAAKAAIVGLTRTMAHELGPHGIRVNCIMPGAILTERQKKLWLTEAYIAEVLSRQALKRLLLPEEVARLALFLAADDSSGITNQSYVIDGGWT
jgi:NAD(P)-dependent dehydrogenase (short-subunit alcohol dehydrogenase family)